MTTWGALGVALIRRFTITTILGCAFIAAGIWAGWWALTRLLDKGLVSFSLHGVACLTLIGFGLWVLWPQLVYERINALIKVEVARMRLRNVRDGISLGNDNNLVGESRD
jgi:hypothetical protein